MDCIQKKCLKRKHNTEENTNHEGSNFVDTNKDENSEKTRMKRNESRNSLDSLEKQMMNTNYNSDYQSSSVVKKRIVGYTPDLVVGYTPGLVVGHTSGIVYKSYGGERVLDSTSSSNSKENLTTQEGKLGDNHGPINSEPTKNVGTSRGSDSQASTDINSNERINGVNSPLGSDSQTSTTDINSDESNTQLDVTKRNSNDKDSGTTSVSEDSGDDNCVKDRVEGWLQKNKKWIKKEACRGKKMDGSSFDPYDF